MSLNIDKPPAMLGGLVQVYLYWDVPMPDYNSLSQTRWDCMYCRVTFTFGHFSALKLKATTSEYQHS